MAVFPIEFLIKNDTLNILSIYEPNLKLIPETEKKFYFANGLDEQIEFETDTNGNLLRVWQIAWGVKKKLENTTRIISYVTAGITFVFFIIDRITR